MLSSHQLPFEAAFRPLLASARAQLVNDVPAIARLSTDQAVTGAVGGLLFDLSYVCAPSLLARFQRFPARRWLEAGRTEAHELFLDHLADSGFELLYSESPELADVVATTISAWHERTKRLLSRIAADRELLARRYGLRIPLESCVPLTDSALRLGNQDGPWFVYKDRPVSIDRAFNGLIASVNQDAPNTQLRVAALDDRDGYGWMEWLSHSPPTGAAWDRYMFRAGMLMCLVHALGGGDIHAGNLRVVGEHPVIIDAEVVLRPRRTRTMSPNPSVMATGWLPTLGEADRCGLAAQQYEKRPGRWIDPNTDSVRRRPLRSVVTGLDEATSEFFRERAEPMTNQVVDGFVAMYRHIRSYGLALDHFVGTQPRVLLRTSHLYQSAIERSLEPAALASQELRAAPLEHLVAAPPDAVGGFGGAARQVAAIELASMKRLEVPRFYIDATGTDLLWNGGSLGPVFESTPLARAEQFLSRLDHAAMTQGCRAIEDSIRHAAHNDFPATRPQLHLMPVPSWT